MVVLQTSGRYLEVIINSGLTIVNSDYISAQVLTFIDIQTKIGFVNVTQLIIRLQDNCFLITKDVVNLKQEMMKVPYQLLMTSL